MKRSEKIEKIRMLYELEGLVLKKKKTAADKKRIKELRETMNLDSPKQGRYSNFNPKEYLEIQKRYPSMPDKDIAKIMNIARSTLLLGKKRHGLSKKYNKETA